MDFTEFEGKDYPFVILNQCAVFRFAKDEFNFVGPQQEGHSHTFDRVRELLDNPTEFVLCPVLVGCGISRKEVIEKLYDALLDLILK